MGRDAGGAWPGPELPGGPRKAHPVRVREGFLADHHVPERLLHRAGLRRDAECWSTVHPGDPDPTDSKRASAWFRFCSIPESPRSRLRSLPYPEPFRVSGATAHRVNDTHRNGGKVIAIGTTVVRALETVVDERGRLHAGSGWTETVITPDRCVRSVDGLLTGWHEPEASHLAMLQAIAGSDLLESSYAAALEKRLSMARIRRCAPGAPVRPIRVSGELRASGCRSHSRADFFQVRRSTSIRPVDSRPAVRDSFLPAEPARSRRPGRGLDQ